MTDDSSRTPNRRLILKMVGTSTTLGIAGCQGLGGDDETPTDDEDNDTDRTTEDGEDDESTEEDLTVITIDNPDVDGTTATLFGELETIAASSPATVGFEYGEIDTDDEHEIEVTELETLDQFSAELEGLFGATTYDFKAVGETEHATDRGDSKTFRTQPAWQPQTAPESVPIQDVVGSSHVSSLYHFTDKPLLEEGAERLRELGTDVIKLWDHQLPDKYPYNHDWNAPFDSMRDVLQSEYFQTVFEMDFSTYVFLAHSRTFHSEGWVPIYNGVSDAQLEEVERRFQDVCEYLLRTYDGTGKTFVFQPWELDNHALSPERDEDPDGWRETELSDEVAQYYRKWLGSRQRGVERARDRIESDVSILNAAEVNFVLDANNDGANRVINTIVPETDVDLVSYSAHELEDQIVVNGWSPGHNTENDLDRAEEIITETLDYIEEQAPEPNDYVNALLSENQHNVYLGEFGPALNASFPGEKAAMRAMEKTTEYCLEWGVRWALYWQVYDNEPTTDGEITDNDDVRGFHLIRPDGSKSPTWEYFHDLLEDGTTY